MSNDSSRPRTIGYYEFTKCECGREIIPPRGNSRQPYVKCAWCVSKGGRYGTDYKRNRIQEAEEHLARMRQSNIPTGRGISTERMRT